ncbi:MAG TPA: non-heme iron oxygenase ferredoxin subunit [Candidatus Omnitrophota bacterium]|nr:non-heme iron oxygenase ferredoxin subunit [Candidatus Omnitrophota bacterium]HQO37562.1 non-heme iron oxygenase ferredoxin subunit [Candidatus Omnitrophota bacterium]HQQ05482.1 non-heme iron oxygenase ferredoxin subunit [Candidatus Omnitrophota bacterium]
MFVPVAQTREIASGGMKAVDRGDRKIVICNFNDTFYAVERQCSHQGASLDMGTLDGYILTCPLHYAQFDIRTGEALSGPVPPDPRHPTGDLCSYAVKVENDTILVEIK